jgi:hypothetical protein
MKNISLTALSLTSLSKAPYFSLTESRNPFSFSIKNSQFNKFSNNLLRSHASSASIVLRSSRISNFLSSAIYVDTRAIAKKTYRELIENSKSNINIGREADCVACQEMIFINCSTEFDGGAVFCVVGGDFYCNFSAFSSCYTKGDYKGGAVYCISNCSNFTGSCFVDCASKIASCVYSPEVTYLISYELCQVNEITPSVADYENPKNLFHLCGRDILMTGGNISKCSIDTPLMLSPAHNLYYFHNQFDDIKSISSLPVFLLQQMNNRMDFNCSNIINCQAALSPLFDAYGSSFSLNQMIIMNNSISYLLHYENEMSIKNLTITECIFSFKKDILVDSAEIYVADINSTFENTTATFYSFDVVSTVGCWEHSTYKWENAAIWKQGIVLGFLLASVVFAIAAVVYHKGKEIVAKKDDDDDEGLLDDY